MRAMPARLTPEVSLGGVDASKRHRYMAGLALARAGRAGLRRLIAKQERPDSFRKSLHREPADIKVVVQFT